MTKRKKRELLPISKKKVGEKQYGDAWDTKRKNTKRKRKKDNKKPMPKANKKRTRSKSIQIRVYEDFYEDWKAWDNPDKVRLVRAFIAERMGII